MLKEFFFPSPYLWRNLFLIISFDCLRLNFPHSSWYLMPNSFGSNFGSFKSKAVAARKGQSNKPVTVICRDTTNMIFENAPRLKWLTVINFYKSKKGQFFPLSNNEQNLMYWTLDSWTQYLANTHAHAHAHARAHTHIHTHTHIYIYISILWSS